MDAEKAAKLRQIIERAKGDLTSRHNLIHAAMRGEFMSAIYSAGVPSSRSQNSIDRKLSDIGNEAAKVEREIAKSVTQELYAVVDWVETPKMVENLFTFQRDVVRQIGREARAVSSLFSKVQININALTKDKHLSAKSQALQHITKPGVFTYKDKVGKTWDAKTYLRTHGSKYYYGLANELAVGDISSEGRKTATLDRPGHDSDGLEFDLNDIDVPRYFHPGSQGILV